MTNFYLIPLLVVFTIGAIAEDSITLKEVKGRPIPGQSETTPRVISITGPEFQLLKADIQEAIILLGSTTQWTDYGPDAAFLSMNISYGNKTYILNSWHPLHKDNPKIAVSETRGLVSVSNLTEKEKIESGNSKKYQTLVTLFDKVIKIHQQESLKHSK
jgi:hypothetical protein